jgi:hypothetical protein
MHGLKRLLIGAMVPMLTIGSASAQWEHLCPGGNWVQSGLGYTCVERPQTPMPRFNPQYEAPAPRDNVYNNFITRESVRLSGLIMRGQPLRQNIPLSSGVAVQQTYIAPPAKYVDPFYGPKNTIDLSSGNSSRSSYTITERDLDYLRSNQVGLQPPIR